MKVGRRLFVFVSHVNSLEQLFHVRIINQNGKSVSFSFCHHNRVFTITLTHSLLLVIAFSLSFPFAVV